MIINYHDNNKNLLEKILEKEIKKIFLRLKMGLADWDIDAILRDALQEPSNIEQIKDILKKYDETFDIAIKSNTQINDKYKTLYKINK